MYLTPTLVGRADIKKSKLKGITWIHVPSTWWRLAPYPMR